MKFPVLLFTIITLATAVVTTAHSQPYDRGDRDRDHYDRDRGDRDRDDHDWQDRWRWRCQRDYDWCRRLCVRDEYGYLRCRHDDDDRYDWRDYWLFRRGYQHYYGR